MNQKSENKYLLSNTSRALGATRFIMAFAVLAIFIGATALLIIGSIDLVEGILREIFGVTESESGYELELVLIESIDSILISTVLYVIAAGLYQLFVNPSLDLPSWMQTDDVETLERRLSGMIVTILGVTFLTKAITSNSSQELLWSGLAISSIIIAISLFLYQEKKSIK